MQDLVIPIIVAIVSGVMTGIVSSMGTVSSLKVHIQYLRETIEKHDVRLRAVEKDSHTLVAAIEKGPTIAGRPVSGVREQG